MTPIERFHSFVLIITVSVMFVGVNYSVQVTSTAQPLGYVAAIVIAALGSVGVYKLAANLVHWLLYKWHWLLKITLGPYYVKGVWGGIILTRSGRPLYAVEKIEQTLSTISIRGTSYRPDKAPDANWITESAQIDPVRGEMFIFYSNNIPWKNNRVEALGRLQFDRENEGCGPKGMTGYAIDSDSTEKLQYVILQRLSAEDVNTSAIDETIRLFRDQYTLLESQSPVIQPQP